ncbi:hypothetical protein BFJ68_g15976 [Fusarium oxysporum]|uniref:Uncharacterized protein n=1 Tax=Fusarium oxysporum TaxID=5507 RepID=A0A420PI42_FUSOX|nr:hypothetical protein BFJ71_g15574 [Fusarium oxysporum]RKK92172.1 hypothetical protein BFJ68_g15976 [Fusarium oxysporum]
MKEPATQSEQTHNPTQSTNTSSKGAETASFTVSNSENISQWYQEVILKDRLVEYYDEVGWTLRASSVNHVYLERVAKVVLGLHEGAAR